MSRKKRDRVESRDVTGLKYFDKLAPLLERLHDDGCERDRAANRELHYDQYCLLILLYLFNPVVTSLRGIQQASELEKVQRKLGCPRAALGSLSEAATVFDPERLKEIIAELGAELQPLARNPRLKDIDQTLTLVDGTLVSALPKLMQASWLKKQTGSPGAPGVKWRLHTHFEVERYVPTRIDVTPEGGGAHDERAVLERTIEIFFRFFKHLLGCRHLLSHNQNGIEIQTYCAIIACLLISLWTGRKPTLRTYEMICFYFCGLATEAELLAHLDKLKRQDEAAARKAAAQKK